MPDDALDHLVDLLGLATSIWTQRVESGVTKHRGSVLEVCRVAAADDVARPSVAEALRDREADPGAATGDHRDLTLEQRVLEHDVRLRGVEWAPTGPGRR